MSQARKLFGLLAAVAIATSVMCQSIARGDGVKSGRQPLTLTPVSRTGLVTALREGHVVVFGVEPSRNRLAMGWGQVAFENGYGKKVYNHNFGNVGPVAGQERLPWYLNPTDGGRYLHHDTFVEGAAAYWTYLKQRCSVALKLFDQGRAWDAALQMGRCGYFGLDAKKYASIMSATFHVGLTQAIPEEENERQVEAARIANVADAGSD
jgi:hypothetical protein